MTDPQRTERDEELETEPVGTADMDGAGEDEQDQAFDGEPFDPEAEPDGR